MTHNMTAEGEFLNLVGSVLSNREPESLPDGITADDIFAIGSRQDMMPTTFCALNSIKPKPESDRWDEYEKRFLDDCMRSEIQMEEYQKLLEYLSGNGVKILPLKGCVIKGMYPSPNLRVMSDVDLLYDGVSVKRLAELMEARGYSTESLEAGNHDVFHKKPCMNIEMHRMLMADSSPYRGAFQDMFDRAVNDESIPNLYHMKPEDLYLHVIAHAAKHFEGSGLGIRPVADIYVINRKYADTWDREYLDSELKSIGLGRFEAKIRSVALSFFGEDEAELSDRDFKFFFRGSTYGQYGRTSWAYMSTGKSSTFGFLFHRIFLPYSTVKTMYPKMGRYPILLPVMWVRRIIEVLLFRRWNILKVVKDANEIDAETASYAHRIMADFGLLPEAGK